MTIQTSPSVATVETDFSTIVPMAATGAGAIAGQFVSGPILQPTLISSVSDLERVFGQPTNTNYKEWFTAWNFLQYSGSLWVTRIKATGVMNAAALKGGVSTGIELDNQIAYDMADSISLAAAGEWICKQPGGLGNAIEVIMVDNGSWGAFYNDSLKSNSFNIAAASITTNVCTISGNDFPFANGDVVSISGFSGGDTEFNVSNVTLITATSTELSFTLNAADTTALDVTSAVVKGTSIYTSESRHLSAYLKYGQPDTTQSIAVTNNAALDEVIIYVIDKTGAITGVAGRIIELWEGLSKISDAIDYMGRGIFYANFMNIYSNWVYFGIAPAVGISGTTWGVSSAEMATGTFKQLTGVYDVQMVAGSNGTLTDLTKVGALEAGYATFNDKEAIQIAYIMTVDYPVAVVQYAVDIAETRRDCIVFISANNNGVPFVNKTTVVTDVQSYRDITLNINSSYALLDSGYKYQFDGYNQVYRWIPINGDTAGLCANLDANYQSWFSPGGFTRGVIKNAVKLSTPLNQAARDVLYPKQVNAVVSFPGKGTVLFGDRTMLAKPSAFQSYNIRRLFIILEKAIQTAAQYQLFELNTPATRATFLGMVNPFLANIKANQGVSDFLTVCDRTNNTDETMASGQFVAAIYIKPLYSTQFVILNFVAVKSAVQFNTLNA